MGKARTRAEKVWADLQHARADAEWHEQENPTGASLFESGKVLMDVAHRVDSAAVPGRALKSVTNSM